MSLLWQCADDAVHCHRAVIVAVSGANVFQAQCRMRTTARRTEARVQRGWGRGSRKKRTTIRRCIRKRGRLLMDGNVLSKCTNS